MAYSELIKSFARIRQYMREFYVYGLKNRMEYDGKSARSYDNERRRVESWLGEYMSFRRTPAGKNVFLSIDSRRSVPNPLYKAFKSKSFTDMDITLHFMLLDILYAPDVRLALPEILAAIDRDYLSRFLCPMAFDESTVRKKCKEYVTLGLLESEKSGRQTVYRRSAALDLTNRQDAVRFFSEAGLAGVVGSYLLDLLPPQPTVFRFKHHYIFHALESEILCGLLLAMREKRAVMLRFYTYRSGEIRESENVPLRIFVSVQSGRRYLLSYHLRAHRYVSCRLDAIVSVKPGDVCPDFDAFRLALAEKRRHMWGVLCDDRPEAALEHVAFTVRIADGEAYIENRLMREKRCGSVIKLDAHTLRFEADVYNTVEMIPWIRTFLCRIESIDFSNRDAAERFRHDFRAMCDLYGAGGDADGLS